MSNIDNNKRGSVTSGEYFTDTLSIPEDVTQEPTLDIAQEPYLLCEADFIRIKGHFQGSISWAIVILSASIGMALIYFAKLFEIHVIGNPVNIETYEWLTPLVGVCLFVILLLICRFIPSEKTRLMNDIKIHFANAPRKKQLRGKKH